MLPRGQHRSGVSLNSGRAQRALDQVGRKVADGALLTSGFLFKKLGHSGSKDHLDSNTLRHAQNIV